MTSTLIVIVYCWDDYNLLQRTLCNDRGRYSFNNFAILLCSRRKRTCIDERKGCSFTRMSPAIKSSWRWGRWRLHQFNESVWATKERKVNSINANYNILPIFILIFFIPSFLHFRWLVDIALTQIMGSEAKRGSLIKCQYLSVHFLYFCFCTAK